MSKTNFLVFFFSLFTIVRALIDDCDISMSTRIIIKNLPHNITPIRLKSHFSASESGTSFFHGQVTDTNILKDPKTGKSRGFAFIGYRTPEQAQHAVEWFNGTFIDQRKIAVDLAKPVNLVKEKDADIGWR